MTYSQHLQQRRMQNPFLISGSAQKFFERMKCFSDWHTSKVDFFAIPFIARCEVMRVSRQCVFSNATWRVNARKWGNL